METVYSGEIRRMGNKDSPDAQYFLFLTPEEMPQESRYSIDFVCRLCRIPINQMELIEKEVKRYKGPQDNLLKRIDEILESGKTSKPL